MPRSSYKPLYLTIDSPGSGTSFLTEVLNELDFDIGNRLMLPSYDKPRGLWRNQKIITAHDELLTAFGKDWTTAPFLPTGWGKEPQTQVTLNKLTEILTSDFNSNDIIIVKDPRLSILLPMWKTLAIQLDRPLHTLIMLRSPEAIAQSIKKRNNINSNWGRLIALPYLKSASQNVDIHTNNCFIYEHMITLSAQQLITMLSDLTATHLPSFNTNLENQFQQVIKESLGKPLVNSFEQTAYLNMIEKHQTIIPIHKLSAFISKIFAQDEIKIYTMSASKTKSLLPNRTVSVDILNHTLLNPQSNSDQIESLLESIVERDANIKSLIEESKQAKTRYASMAQLAEERQNQIISERDIVIQLRAKLIELQNLVKSQDHKIRLDDARNKMIENYLEQQNFRLRELVRYYERSPLKASLRAAIFSSLRSLKHIMPVPESMKLTLARKMTGVAQRLQPPEHSSNTSSKFNLTENTKVDILFKETDNPIISIIIPFYNEINQTIACLQSIQQQHINIDYEVILADDKSSDPFHKVLQNIVGVRYFRNEENLHFLRNCNLNAAHARGKYLVFLNNDTIVKPGWLQNLYETFFEHEEVGIVGSKLIYPDGELQEAGGIIWEDASGWNWGKGHNANHPLYNFLRDVDFVSGASLMIPTDLWNEVGGFNENLKKAYYEDVDLCFRVRSMGYRILYKPSSEVVHIEGLSCGTDVTKGAKKHQLVNQKIFSETWQHELKHHFPNGSKPFQASDRNTRGHILYIDATTPEPQKDAGSVNAAYSMRTLIELGYRVHFIAVFNFSHLGAATKNLQNIGIECVYRPFYNNMKSYLKDRGDIFDYIIVSRAECADLFLSTLSKHCPNAKIIYNTVDLHFMRMEREAIIVKDKKIIASAKKMRKKEVSLIKKTDATIVLSEVEHALLSKQKKLATKLWTIPLIRPKAVRLVEFKNTKDIIFVGGYNHKPNIDAVEWLANKIWPEIRKVLPHVKLYICGSAMPDSFQSYAAEDVIVQGFVPDLNALLKKTRLTIAPLRYGAGLKGKVASSIGAGVPCIGTAIAFEGMAQQGLEVVKLLAKTPKDFASLAEKIYNNEELWTKISLAGVEYHNQNFYYKKVSEKYNAMLESLK